MISLLFFASLQEEIGKDQIILKRESATVQEIKQHVLTQFPHVSLEGVMIAVNEEFVRENEVVTAGDTVAFIPPVSGG